MKTDTKSSGLRYWMGRVLEECDHVAQDFSADPVHDLRVALRRCRSMADGMMAMDPDRDWKAMRKAGKRLFQSLGNLRDVQIMMEWIEKLHPRRSQTAASDGSPEPTADRGTLPLRAARIRPGSAVFKHLALERWTAARELHTRALRNRSQIAFHTLRIGIKRFRYIVENFLPEQHKSWSDDLKHMQDLLGEVHDLDVLWAAAVSCHVFPDDASRKSWHARILEERTKRIDEYRSRMVGPASLWDEWRAGLPQGKQIPQIATQRMKLWAKALDPDFAHSERVARLALQLYDGLAAAGLLDRASAPSLTEASNRNGSDARASLNLAALLHDVGKAKGKKGHHKESLDLIKKHGVPLGWKPEAMTRAAIVARFHVGALPTRSHKVLRDLLPDEQKIIIQLAAILRLANAFDNGHDGHVRKLQIENPGPKHKDSKRRTNGFLRKLPVLGPNEAVVIGAEGFVAGSSTAQAVAAERYLLETMLRRPVVVKAIKSSVPRQVAEGSKKIA